MWYAGGMKTFLDNLSHLISHDLAADHARLTSEMKVENAALHARIDALEKQATVMRKALADNAASVLKAKKEK